MVGLRMDFAYPRGDESLRCAGSLDTMGKGGWVIGTARLTIPGTASEVPIGLRFGLGHVPLSAALSTSAPIRG